MGLLLPICSPDFAAIPILLCRGGRGEDVLGMCPCQGGLGGISGLAGLHTYSKMVAPAAPSRGSFC